jgi:hypothetical protein
MEREQMEMNEESERFPAAMDEALTRYFEQDERGDVNVYLDKLGIKHEPVSMFAGKPDPIHVEMPGCGEGYHWVQTTYYNKHDGWNTVGSCVWNSGMH